MVDIQRPFWAFEGLVLCFWLNTLAYRFLKPRNLRLFNPLIATKILLQKALNPQLQGPLVCQFHSLIVFVLTPYL
jgi:hypothetical protein